MKRVSWEVSVRVLVEFRFCFFLRVVFVVILGFLFFYFDFCFRVIIFELCFGVFIFYLVDFSFGFISLFGFFLGFECLDFVC